MDSDLIEVPYFPEAKGENVYLTLAGNFSAAVPPHCESVWIPKELYLERSKFSSKEWNAKMIAYAEAHKNLIAQNK